MKTRQSDSKAEPYVPKLCRRCGSAPKLEHHFDEAGNVSARMRCTGCDRHTHWHMTCWQAQVEWDEVMAC